MKNEKKKRMLSWLKDIPVKVRFIWINLIEFIENGPDLNISFLISGKLPFFLILEFPLLLN